MRYESFYPFARHQPPPNSMGQTGFGPPPRLGQGQGPRQPFMNGPANNPFGGPTSGQGMQQGPSKMESYMQTANRFLNTAQQFAPMVQQFAPMVQNLPAMWRLYKGFQSLPSAGASAGSAASGVASAAQSAVANTPPGPSVPRIFQPPIR
ncbi:VrrA/YqfQ family protein [Sporosarcina sp. JAI121]|uniref:VrrA/YqfQ family protein n=1 Tax=Sporosarcina sp. JAI121 TaxID=2723064 RepID=UPI0015C7D279|nr:VrrA/YqfQ family protein [Sporosarcina sp. JAI121]NYF24566.1 hypothetical protein [Sporosarcina sp. JAI121]